MTAKPSLLLIGTGRAAIHLGHAFVKGGVDVKGVVGRDAERTSALAKVLGTNAIALGDTMPNADVVLLAVADDAIEEVAEKVPSSNAVVAHASGARSMDGLLGHHHHRGVLWPIQTLSSTEPIDLSAVPLIIDGNDEHARKILRKLAESVSSKVTELPHEQRRKVHLAAVLTSNLPVFLLREGQRILKETNLPTDLLDPLWRMTAARVLELGPEKALTGPARRGDVRTLEQHLELLGSDPELRDVYEGLSKLIQKAYPRS